MDAAAQVGCDLKRVGSGDRNDRVLALTGHRRQTARADSYFLTVAGLGGEPEFEQRFEECAKSLDKILRNEAGAKVDTLYGADATKVNVEAKLRALQQPNPTTKSC